MEIEKPLLESMEFTFSQLPNCMSDDHVLEELKIKVVSDLGIDRNDGGHFYVIETQKWSFDTVDELQALVDRIKKVI